jgi:hypothetical protein
VVGQSTTETMTVPEVWIPPPIDLGPPLPGEPIRKVSYWYVRSYPDSFAKYLHLYELDPQDRDMLWEALHPPPAWELPDGSGGKAARPASRD